MGKKKFTLILTHDVDRVRKTYQYFTKFLKERRIYHLKSLVRKIAFGEEPYWNFEKIIEIEEKYGVKSTFFFLNESARFNPLSPSSWKIALGRYKITESKVKKMIRWLNRHGWEIGLHGSYNSFLSLDLLKKEKKELEKIVGKKILGIRQHYLRLKNFETWKLQAEVGFKYDSSYGFNDKVGFKNEKYRPFRPFKEKKDFLVFPLALMDVALFNYRNRERACMKIIKIAQRRRAVLVVNWHQRIFNEDEFPGFEKLYKKIIEESLKRNAKVLTLREAYKEEMGNERRNDKSLYS